MNVYTMEQWARDGDFKTEPGQEITQKLAEGARLYRENRTLTTSEDN